MHCADISVIRNFRMACRSGARDHLIQRNRSTRVVANGLHAADRYTLCLPVTHGRLSHIKVTRHLRSASWFRIKPSV